VNDIYCASMAEAARRASCLLSRKVELWQVQKIVNGRMKIAGLDIKERQQCRKNNIPYYKNNMPYPRRSILCYPIGESPVEKGLPEQWR